ncbi:XRE family transcriptional regulator [Bradyrhizobium sp.]|uniref:XRE family transcriptional regulator n=1 Tax=Bradyrhizobium sp. TaxID=376 RepID=UPI003C6F5632
MDVVRKLIQDRLRELRLTMAEVSQRLNRNPTYLQQFLKKGSPRELQERERIALAEILNVPEDQLRGPSSPLPKRHYAKNAQEVPSREGLVDTNPRPTQNTDGAPRMIPGAELYANVDLPVFGSAQTGNGALIITDRPVDYVARPTVLLRVQDGYGMIVVGDSMEPVIRAGAVALINPHKPPHIGDLCLFRQHSEDGSVHAAIKEFRGQTDTTWKVRQYNPAKDFVLKKSEWQICHRLVGSYF